MSELRTVVVTGASRGLGLASSAHLYRRGWRVVAAMRSVDAGMERLRRATGASEGDPRLAGVRLDLDDPESITAAAGAITEHGAPDVVVHNAGIAAAGHIEETPMEVWEGMLSTHLLGPLFLTRALLPPMRAAGRGRIICVSSQGGVRGMPVIAAYSAAKGALERWAEALAGEVAPFGLGVTVLVTGTFDTDIITDAGVQDHRAFTGPYGGQNRAIDRRGRAISRRLAAPPERFAKAVSRAAEDTAPFVRRPVGPDARLLLAGNRLLPPRAMHHLTRLALGVPKRGALAADPGGSPEDA